MLRRAVVVFALAACGGGGESQLEEWVIAPQLRPCTGLVPALCMVVSEDGAEPRIEHFGIEGFEFRWGVETTALVRIEPLDAPQADGPGERRILDTVLDERADPVGSTYDLDFLEITDGNVWFQPKAPGVVELFFETQVACEEPLCTELVELGGAAARVELELTGDAATPLRATAVAAP